MIIPGLTVDDMIERAMLMIAGSDRFRNIPVFDQNGALVKIDRLRQYGGFDDNATGVTMSIYPYSYDGTSNETVDSGNVALKYEPLELGSRTPSGGRERAQLRLIVQLSTLGYAQDSSEGSASTNTQGIKFYRSQKEKILYKYLTYIRDILLRKPIVNLAGLIHTSTVNWGSYRTVKWSEKGNAVIHQANLLWNLEFYTATEQNAAYQLITSNVDPNVLIPSWEYIGVRNRDENLCYYDNQLNRIVSQEGVPLIATPKNVPVTWDPVEQRFEQLLTGAPLTTIELEDPVTTPANKPWIDTNLLIVGTLNNRNLFYNKLLGILQFFDGTPVTQLPDGTPIYYDPDTGAVTNGNTNQPIESPQSGFIPLRSGKVSIYEALNLELRESFLF